MTMTAITGNTYPVKDALKAMGAKWNSERKTWMVPAEKAAQAQLLVDGSSPSIQGVRTNTRDLLAQSQRSHGGCKECGAATNGYQYCYGCSKDRREAQRTGVGL